MLPRLLGLMVMMMLLITPAAAMTQCVVGGKVILPGGEVATVVRAEGSSCTVSGKAANGNALDGVWSAFMLEPASAGATASNDDASLSAGKYQCWANGNYLFVDITVYEDSSYADGTGARGRLAYYDDGTIEFPSGPFRGYGGEARDGFVYLRQPGTQSSIQCGRH